MNCAPFRPHASAQSAGYGSAPRTMAILNGIRVSRNRLGVGGLAALFGGGRILDVGLLWIRHKTPLAVNLTAAPFEGAKNAAGLLTKKVATTKEAASPPEAPKATSED